MSNQSQSNTFVPGMESGASNSLYSRKDVSRNEGNMNETMVSGFQPQVKQERKDEPSTPDRNVPIVGFLYSISRGGLPEFWPLHLGTNTIGRSEDNDVQLKEQTVSANHAVLSIKQMKSTGRFIASIKDVGSKSGMFLNAEELDYDNHTCKHEDVITVGENYKLLLLLIDAANYDLKPAESFIPVNETQISEQKIPEMPTPFMGTPTTGPYTRPSHINDGTVDLSGSNYHTSEGGETRILE